MSSTMANSTLANSPLANSPLAEYTSARATVEIVDREEALDKAYKAIADPSDQTYVMYITAGGGWGKTRLVEEVLKQLKNAEPGSKWSFPGVLTAERLVDLYHIWTHSTEGLINEIVAVLDPEENHFQTFRAEREKLERIKEDIAEILREATTQRKKMFDAFLQDFQKLHLHHRRVVLALDTSEALVYQPDRLHEILGTEAAETGVTGWLVKHFLPYIQNAVVLIAGRPEQPKLEKDLKAIPGINYDHHKLRPFEEEESLQYLDRVAQAAALEDPMGARWISEIPNEKKRVIHYLSGGQPFMLALIVDHLAVATEPLPQLRMSLKDAKACMQDENERQKVQQSFKESILRAIQEYRRPQDDFIRLLGWTPKGMRDEILAWIEKGEHPRSADILKARKKLDALRDPKNRLSFVKIHAQDRAVFLQDEMYALLRPERLSTIPSKMEERYRRILSFYEHKIKRTREIIKEGQEQGLSSGRLWASSPVARQRNGQNHKTKQALYEARKVLQSLQVEHVFYALTFDPLDGYELFSRYAEEAFQSNDDNLWLELRDELLKFLKDSHNQERLQTSPLNLDDIDVDLAIRWIKSTIARGEYPQALKMIARLRKSAPELVKDGSLADLNLNIWEAWALTYSGKNKARAKDLLDEIGQKIALLPDGTDFDRWRRDLLRANQVTTLGYFYRSQGLFDQAVSLYLEALPLWRVLGLEAEHANALNNLSWVEAEVGDFRSALAHSQDALSLRILLGRRYTMALSLNTYGLIETRYDRPERAKKICEEAYQIFKELEQPRGVGLAATALSEALRRITNVPNMVSPNRAIKYLEQAAKLAEEAVEIFEDQVQEPLRLVEARLELGCIYRELAQRMLDRKKREECERFALQGEKTLLKSAELAENEFRYRAVDALVNLAWLYYYTEKDKQAETLLKDRVRRLIPEEYLIQKDQTIREVQAPVRWYWVQLGKADLLLGQIAFDRYLKARIEGAGEKATEALKYAAHTWALALAYDARYGKDFRDLEAGKQRVYDNLKGLKLEALNEVTQEVRNTYRQYQIPSDLRIFNSFLQVRFGIDPDKNGD